MKANTVFKFCLGLLLAVFLIHQLYASLYKPITTESATYYEAVEGYHITGVIVREERFVTCNTAGVYHYRVADGARVAKGGVLADIYDSESASIAMSQISALNAQIENLTDLQNYNNQQAVDLDLINNQVDAAFSTVICDCGAGNFGAVADASAQLLANLNRRQVVTGSLTDFSEKLAALNAELASLNASLPAEKGRIVAQQSGYFSNVCDGYETVLVPENLSAITVEYLDRLQPAAVPADAVGKIVSDYEWYIAAKIPLNDSLRYKVGDRLTLQTALQGNLELSVKVAQINVSETAESAVVLFSCNQMNTALATVRSGAMTIVQETYKGLAVSKNALRVVKVSDEETKKEKSETGVYVVSGMSLKFVPVDVIFNKDSYDYIICKQEKSNGNVLRQYDEVVVKGKNLYDGKIVG